MSKDIFSHAKVIEGIPPTTQSNNTAITGNIIDRSSYGALTYLIYTGTLTTGAATFTPSLEHGDAANLSDSAVPAAKELIETIAGATFAGTDDNKSFVLGYNGSKRYVRLTITPASNVAAATVGALAVLIDGAFNTSTNSTMP